MRASGYERQQDDWYCEPRWLVDALLDVESFDGVVLDPSCGGGNIPLALRDRGINAVGTDLVNRGFGIAPLDFFETKFVVTSIVTNPPFRDIERYIRHALSCTEDRVVVLARLALLESQERADLFSTTPFARVWVSRRRASMPPGNSNTPAKGGTMAYGWFVWEHGFVGKPTVGWV